MSDGPDVTLQMRQGWCAVAKCGSREASEVEEICQKLPPALAQEWRAEVPSELVNALRRFFLVTVVSGRSSMISRSNGWWRFAVSPPAARWEPY